MKIPILTYHEILSNLRSSGKIDSIRSAFCVTADQFEEQLNFLFERKYKTLTVTQLLELRKNNNERRKFVVLTFDDGYVGNYLYAYPLLKKFKFKATFFVIVTRIGKPNYMTWSQLKEMSNNEMDIQSHTLNHRPLQVLGTESSKGELLESKRILEKKLGERIDIVSYPGGSYNKEIIGVARRAGYLGSCTSDIGYFNLRDDPYNIKRIDIKSGFSLNVFQGIIEGNRFLILKLKLAKSIKNKVKNILGIENYIRVYSHFFKIKMKKT